MSTSIKREFSDSLEAVRRAACTNGRVLLDPPPALFHPSKGPACDFLYASKERSEFEDVQLQRGRWKIPQSAHLCAVVMVDVCMDSASPALVYVSRHSEAHSEAHDEIVVVVPCSPLGAMEVELFSKEKAPSAFECEWLGPEARSTQEMRADVGKHIHAQGRRATPDFVINGPYFASREGPLPFLRMRGPQNGAEEEAQRQMLEAFSCAPLSTRPLKEVCAKGENFRLRTVFCRSRLMQSPMDEWEEISQVQLEVDSVGAEGDEAQVVDKMAILDNSIIGSLACAILNQVQCVVRTCLPCLPLHGFASDSWVRIQSSRIISLSLVA